MRKGCKRKNKSEELKENIILGAMAIIFFVIAIGLAMKFNVQAYYNYVRENGHTYLQVDECTVENSVRNGDSYIVHFFTPMHDKIYNLKTENPIGKGKKIAVDFDEGYPLKNPVKIAKQPSP